MDHTFFVYSDVRKQASEQASRHIYHHPIIYGKAIERGKKEREEEEEEEEEGSPIFA